MDSIFMVVFSKIFIYFLFYIYFRYNNFYCYIQCLAKVFHSQKSNKIHLD